MRRKEKEGDENTIFIPAAEQRVCRGQVITVIRIERAMSLAISFVSRKKPRVPRAVWLAITNAALGPAYELSVVFVDARAMRKLNSTYRNKPFSTDILSFQLSRRSGEIIFSMKDVRGRAPLFNRAPLNFLTFLFIHGLLHLKGYAHGSRMEAQEIKFRKKFGI